MSVFVYTVYDMVYSVYDYSKILECCMDMCGIAEKDAFVEGVKLGVKIVVETYTDSSQNFKEI